MKTENVKLKFSHELCQMLLNGGVIVHHRETPYISHLIVRLPKGKFNEFKGTHYEYVEFQQYPTDTEVYLAISRNGSKVSVINRAKKEFEDDRFVGWKIEHDQKS